jgi:transketolase
LEVLSLTTQELTSKATAIRETVFRIIHGAGGGHFGGSLSAVEILTVLYYDEMKCNPSNPQCPERDWLILGKGHAGPPLYTVLADKGYFHKDKLKELDTDGGMLPKHVDRLRVPGIEYSSGPLGMGLSFANGVAKAAKIDGKDMRIYVLIGDGECNEGQVWEAAMTSAHFKLDNVVAIIDRNCCQIDGTTDFVMELEPFTDKWVSFGWNVLNTDGHNIMSLQKAFAETRQVKSKPSIIIAETVKGRGISFMENDYQWHSGILTDEQYEQGLRDLQKNIS